MKTKDAKKGTVDIFQIFYLSKAIFYKFSYCSGEFMSKDGGQVDYKGIKQSPQFESYCQLAASLRKTVSSWQ